MSPTQKQMPFFGFALREENRSELAQAVEQQVVDALEITDGRADEPLRGDRYAGELAEVPYVSIHHLKLSVSSPHQPSAEYLQQADRLADDNLAVAHSDHIGFTRAGGIEMGHFTPPPLSRKALDVTCRNTEFLMAHFGRRGRHFFLENTAWWFQLAGAEMSEPEFIRALVRRTGVGLLLDVTNVYANVQNHRAYNGRDFVDEVLADAGRVQVHLAGGEFGKHGFYYDSHSQPIPKEVWHLYEYAVGKATGRIEAVFIERDSNYREGETDWLADIHVARDIIGGK